MRSRFIVALAVSALFLALTAGTLPAAQEAADFGTVPVKGMVTMIDLGAKRCIPCKMMAPILEKLEKSYDGKAAIVFIDVWMHREQARRFGIRAIPTQIFFNPEGEEVYRHVGFMAEADIIARLKEMGVDRQKGSRF